MIRGNARIVYDAVCTFWLQKVYAPSYEDLQELTGLSRGSVQHHVKTMLDNGDLFQAKGIARSLRPKGMSIDLSEAKQHAEGL